MSYDLIMWKKGPAAEASLVWAQLREGEVVEGLAPLTAAEVVGAFQAIFGDAVKIGDHGIMGPHFELHGLDGPYVQVCCSWTLAGSDTSPNVLSKIHRVGARLGACVFDPQTSADAPVDPALESKVADLAELGPARRVVHSLAGEDRAQSFGRVDRWQVRGRDGSKAAIHSLFLGAAGGGISSKHGSHPANLTDVVCDYARLVQSVLPFEVLVASGRGRTKDGMTRPLSNQLFAVVDGRVGFLGSPRNTLVTEDGETISCWTGIELSATGPLAARRGSVVDLTEVVAASARDALSRAHAGDTRPLREWMVLMVAIDTDGLAAEELFAAEVPETRDVGRAFEAFESGALMPVWSQRLAGCFNVEARLRLPEQGGFGLKLITTDRTALRRHELDPPLGP